MLEIKNLSVSYGQHRALDDISVQVAKSEVVVILGANGAGKSSLLRAIAGLSEGNCDGDISFAGQSLLGCSLVARVGSSRYSVYKIYGF